MKNLHERSIKIKKLLITICLLMVLNSGCISGMKRNEKIKQDIQKCRQFVLDHSTDQIKEAVAKGELVIGMNETEVIASKGFPRRINRTTRTWSIHEQWVYGPYFKREFLYLEDGILYTWKD